MSKRVLVVNEEFTPTEEFVEDYVSTQDALPNLLTVLLEDFDVDKRRMQVYDSFPDLAKLDDEESKTALKLLRQGKKSEAEDYQIQLVLDFIEKYPQFGVMIKGVESQTSGIVRLILDTIRQAFVGEF